VIRVVEITVKVVALLAPNITAVTPVKFVPVMSRLSRRWYFPHWG